MNAQDAYASLDPKVWTKTSVLERFVLIEDIQNNQRKYARELGATDAEMKNALIGEDFVSYQEGMGSTVNAMGNALNYENITKSVIVDEFGASAFELTDRQQFLHLLENASLFSIDQVLGAFRRTSRANDD